MSDTPLLEVTDLRTHFFTDDGVVRAVDGVSFAVERGATLGIVGESGCGKSITARSIINMIRPPGRIVGGEILFRRDGAAAPVDIVKLDPEGKEIRSIRWAEISMIFQEPMTSLSPVHSVGEQMVEALEIHLHLGRTEAAKRSVDLLGRVGLARPKELMDRYRHQLSGGMRQRVMIAMALTCEPALLIADEPTTALDVTTQAQILELLADLQQEFGMAMVFITHDLGVIAEIADDVLVMYLGRQVEEADVDTVFHAPAHPYTRALLGSIPRRGAGRRLEVISGAVPDPLNAPEGCTFHPRCPHYDPARCASPELVALAPGHRARCARTDELPEFHLGDHAG